MQKARCHRPKTTPTACKRMVSESFHSLAQGSFHLSFTVLVRYRSTSSIQAQRMVPLDSDKVSPASPYSGYCYVYNTFRLQDFHLLRLTFPNHSTKYYMSISQSYNPNEHAHWFGLFRFRSPLLTESLLFSLPLLTQMFQFSRFAFYLKQNNRSSIYWVAPFGNLRIEGLVHLPEAYRSLTRPSSPPRAQASPIRP